MKDIPTNEVMQNVFCINLFCSVPNYSWETEVSTETKNSSMSASLHVDSAIEFIVNGCGLSSQECCGRHQFLIIPGKPSEYWNKNSAMSASLM